MRASRLLTILITLQLRGRVTAQALADQFEVSKRTIYRDVDELSAAGVPIYAERGRTGGFALLDGFRTEVTGLTQGETEALLLAGVPAAAADLGLAGEASAARIKLLASVPRGAAETAGRIGDRFYLDPLGWYRTPGPPEHLKPAAQCVWEARRLEIDYVSWKRTSTSVIEPLGLILKAGDWYLLAAGVDNPRIYRLDKIRRARVGASTFERPRDFDLATAWRRCVERFEVDLGRLPATLRASVSADDRLHRLGDAVADRLRSAPADAHGRRKARVRLESIDHAAGLLLGFADEIEVLEPPELQAELARRAAAVAALYPSAGG